MAPVKKRMEEATLRDVRLMWRNFEGREGQFNAQGDRNFVVFLSPEQAEELDSLGWGVKQLEAREEGEEPQAFVKVKIKYSERARPPRVVMITSRGRTNLDESMLMVLDWVDIEKCDLIIRPYQWDVRGQTGVSAYLQAIYVTIREDELEQEYADIPELEGSRQALTSGADNSLEDLGEVDILEIER